MTKSPVSISYNQKWGKNKRTYISISHMFVVFTLQGTSNNKIASQLNLSIVIIAAVI